MRRFLPRGARQWTAAAIAVGAFLLWSGVAIWMSRTIFYEHNPRRAAWECEQPAGVYGTSTFDPWPPGRVCMYDDGTVSEVDPARAVVIVMLAVTALFGIGIAVLVYAAAARSSRASRRESVMPRHT